MQLSISKKNELGATLICKDMYLEYDSSLKQADEALLLANSQFSQSNKYKNQLGAFLFFKQQELFDQLLPRKERLAINYQRSIIKQFLHLSSVFTSSTFSKQILQQIEKPAQLASGLLKKTDQTLIQLIYHKIISMNGFQLLPTVDDSSLVKSLDIYLLNKDKNMESRAYYLSLLTSRRQN
eukprot:403339118